ncbi:LCCL domain-containing protein [Streptomyces paradoxus]|uniref:LCCL domain-containing protein n=1 Tax=Streptomyces paradoxus TaxID=66375 RepID=UPI003638500B
MPTLFQKEELGSLHVIADAHGGQGKVFEAPRVRIYGRPAVYKEYHRHALTELDVNQLRRMVLFPSKLPESKRRELYQMAAWPSAVVEESGQARGFVMPRVSDNFFCSLQLPYGQDEVLGQYQLLLNGDRYLRNVEISVSDTDRIFLALSVARTLRFFHNHRITVGDFSPNNILFDLQRHQSCFIDCDAMLLDGVGALPQGETPDWDVGVPGEPLGTVQSDIFKFGLLFLRLFAGDQMIRDPDEVEGRIPPDLFKLLRLSLSDKSRERPSVDEWIKVIQKHPDGTTLAPASKRSRKAEQKKTRHSRNQPATTTTQSTGRKRSTGAKAAIAAISSIAVVLAVIMAVVISGSRDKNEDETAPTITEPPRTATSETTGVSTANSPQPISWSMTAQDLTEAPIGSRLTVSCPPSGVAETIYGTDLYTDDSSICTAAVHAGGISMEDGGKVTIIIRPGGEEYLGSHRNGVTSSDWNASWDRSFEIVSGRPESPTHYTRIAWSKTAEEYRGQVGKKLTFECLPGGEAMSIWGTGRYTDDSSICTAGVHAGEFSFKNGGVISIVISGSHSNFEGTTQNGVTSEDYAEWPGSFVIVD